MKRVIFKYGIAMFLAFTSFFLLMHLSGYSTNHNLRVFNGVIHLSLIYFAIKEFFAKDKGSTINYFKGVAVGMSTSMIGVIPFCLFQLIHLELNPEFMEAIKATTPLGYSLTPFKASFVILAEGIFVSYVCSYIVTRGLEMYSDKPYVS